VYGRLRDDQLFVKAIQKSQAQADLNEKFITTECIADRRIKISSMANRQYAIAPSIENVRKQGQHQMILQAINKKQTFPELINQANAMVTSVLHDPLKRSLNVMPSRCSFGLVKAGTMYEMVLTLKNEDSISQRLFIKPMLNKHVLVQQVEFGAVAPGMMKKVSVVIKSNEDDDFSVKEDIQIVTKTDIFKIPVEAQVVPAEKFEEANKESQALKGKTVQNSRVRERLTSSRQAARNYQDQYGSKFENQYSSKKIDPETGREMEDWGGHNDSSMHENQQIMTTGS